MKASSPDPVEPCLTRNHGYRMHLGAIRKTMARLNEDPARFRITCAGYTIECTPSGLPLIYDRLKSTLRSSKR